MVILFPTYGHHNSIWLSWSVLHWLYYPHRWVLSFIAAFSDFIFICNITFIDISVRIDGELWYVCFRIFWDAYSTIIFNGSRYDFYGILWFEFNEMRRYVHIDATAWNALNREEKINESQWFLHKNGVLYTNAHKHSSHFNKKSSGISLECLIEEKMGRITRHTERIDQVRQA